MNDGVGRSFVIIFTQERLFPMTQITSRTPAAPAVRVGTDPAPFFRRTVVFKGNVGGYKFYRCPVLARTATGRCCSAPTHATARPIGGGSTWCFRAAPTAG